MMEYKSYLSHIEFDSESDIFHGEVINIRDVITFQGKSVEELKQAFRDSVEDYLEFCAERGEEPDQPCLSVKRNPQKGLKNLFTPMCSF